MKENILHKLTITINAQLDEENAKELIGEYLYTIDYAYSYLVFAEYLDKKLARFIVEVLVSQSDYYNCLKKQDVINGIWQVIEQTKEQEVEKRVVGYKQPPLDKMLQAYEPLVHSLSRQQQTYWKNLEYEDLCQMCRLVICTLYKAGYYVHKNLIRRAFTNEVLMSIRKERYKPTIVSLDKPIGGDTDNVYVKDVIPDTSQLQHMQDEEDDEVFMTMLKEQRELVIDMIGQRQYDRLLSEYGSGSTSSWGQKTTYRLRERLKKEGVTERTFWRRY